ncbi:MAG TPA: glycosyltransferase family 1 protein [bacterium]|nr:glycosyltransferase family 1 protein [bacterium]HPN29836.1 glycosyltransferase family 1 protein [bacterium]
MNIGIDVRELSFGGTGISQYTLNLINYIIQNDKINSYFLFSNKPFELKNKNAGFKIIIFNKIKFNPFFDFIALPYLLKKYSIGLFISPYYKLPFPVSVPCVITVHDIGFITFPLEFYGRSGFYRFFAKYYLYFSLLKSKKIFTVSNYTKNEILKNYKIDESKIHILPNSINEVFRKGERSDAEPAKTGTYNDFGIYALSVGNFKPHKNIKNLVIGFSKIISNSNLNLVLAGSKSKRRDEIEKYVETNGLGKRIFFINPKNNFELKNLYSSAEMLIHPSLHEGFGLPPVEAQSCGTPVISSDRTSLREILNDSCLFINPELPEDIAEKILTLHTDERLRQTLKEKGLENVRRFYPDRSYSEYFKVINYFAEKPSQ